MRKQLRHLTVRFGLGLWALSLSLVRISAESKVEGDQPPPTSQASDLYARNWLEQDVAYLISNEERAAFQELNSDQERFWFVEQFWLRRDPTCKTVENEVKQEHYRRLAYTNKKFAADVPGWRSDRSMIYVLLGPPDKIEILRTRESTQSSLFSEIWHYRNVPGLSTGKEVNFEFVDKSHNDSYQLLMDPAAEELLDWFKVGLPWKKSRVTECQGGPQIRYKDLQVVLNIKMNYDLLPFKCRTTFEKVTDATVLATIGIQVQNKDLTYREEYRTMWTAVRIFGRVTDSHGRVWDSFEAEMRPEVPKPFLKEVTGGASYFQTTIPLKAGQYRLELALKELKSQNVGTLYQSLVVPDQK